MYPSIRRPAALLALCLAFGLGAEARAASLVLSNATSDPAVAAERLDGRLEVDVSGGKNNQRLTLTLSNATAAPDAFSIVAILFNASEAVTGVDLDRVTSSRGGTVTSAWSLVASTGAGGATDAGRLGLFDYAVLTTGAGAAPGDVLTLRIDVEGDGKLEVDDFVEPSALTGAGQIATLGAGRFRAGATIVYGGAHAPEPGTFAMLLCGLLGLAMARRHPPQPAVAPPRHARVAPPRRTARR